MTLISRLIYENQIKSIVCDFYNILN